MRPAIGSAGTVRPDFAKFLIEARKKANLSQTQLAERAGWKHGAGRVSRLENSIVPPGRRDVARLAAALRIGKTAFSAQAAADAGQAVPGPEPRKGPSRDFGAILRTLRRETRMSQTELAARAGWRSGAARISRLEKGVFSPSDKDVHRIAAALQVPAETFIAGAKARGPMPHPMRHWVFNRDRSVLAHVEQGRTFRVPLNRIQTPKEMLAWLEQIARKPWGNDEVLGEFTRFATPHLAGGRPNMKRKTA